MYIYSLYRFIDLAKLNVLFGVLTKTKFLDRSNYFFLLSILEKERLIM